MNPAAIYDRALFPRSQFVSLPVHLMASGDRRLDGEAYISDGFLYRHQICGLGETQTLGSLVEVVLPGRLKGVRVDQRFGTPFLVATQVFDIWPEPRKWLAESKIPDPKGLFVDRGVILVTRSGTVGTATIAYMPHLEKIISDDLLRVRARDESKRGYIYTFLKSKFGRGLMRSSRYGNVIKHLEVDHLESVPIPVFDDLIDELHQDIEDVFRMRDDAYSSDMEVRACLDSEVTTAPRVQQEGGFEISADLLFSAGRRLFAYAHNPLALAVIAAIEQHGRFDALGDLARTIQPQRFKRIYGEGGAPYLSSDELFRINPEITKFLMEATDTELGDLQVKAGWILLSCSGQIYGLNGSVVLATEWHEDKILTHDLIRIVPDDEKIRSGYLQAVLSHPRFGRVLLLRNAYGTSIPHLESADVRATPIVRLDATVENEIADATERASKLRMKADEKENGAVAKLERRIASKLGEGKGEAIRVDLPFDEAISRALQVKPPKEGWKKAPKKKRSGRKKR